MVPYKYMPQAGFDPPEYRVMPLMKQALYPQATTAGYLEVLYKNKAGVS